MSTCIKIECEYDGAPFAGWARQPDEPSVEESFRDAFAACACEVTQLVCAARTDAGVHAACQIIGVHYTGSVSPERLKPALNSNLPPQISVLSVSTVPSDFTARGDAISRAYEYRVLYRRARAPLRAAYTLHHPQRLDVELLERCAIAVLGQHEFTALTPADTKHVFFGRTVLESRWETRGDELVYCIRADAFLRHMVRILVGTMLAVARGERSYEDFVAMLDDSPRSAAGKTSLPHALCLVDVEYRG